MLGMRNMHRKGTSCLQEVWEAQAAIVERSAKEAAEGGHIEIEADGEGSSSRQHSAYQAQIERLLAADVVLVPYGVLSQEVRNPPLASLHLQHSAVSIVLAAEQ